MVIMILMRQKSKCFVELVARVLLLAKFVDLDYDV